MEANTCRCCASFSLSNYLRKAPNIRHGLHRSPCFMSNDANQREGIRKSKKPNIVISAQPWLRFSNCAFHRTKGIDLSEENIISSLKKSKVKPNPTSNKPNWLLLPLSVPYTSLGALRALSSSLRCASRCSRIRLLHRYLRMASSLAGTTGQNAPTCHRDTKRVPLRSSPRGPPIALFSTCTQHGS